MRRVFIVLSLSLALTGESAEAAPRAVVVLQVQAETTLADRPNLVQTVQDRLLRELSETAAPFFDWRPSGRGVHTITMYLVRTQPYESVKLLEKDKTNPCGGTVLSSADYHLLSKTRNGSVAGISQRLADEVLRDIALCLAENAVQALPIALTTDGLPEQNYIVARIRLAASNRFAYVLHMVSATDQVKYHVALKPLTFGPENEVYLSPSDDGAAERLRSRQKSQDELKIDHEKLNPERVGRIRDRGRL